MYHLLELLRNSAVVSRLEVITFVDEEDIQALYAKAYLRDRSVFFVRELITADESKYSYHWQTARGALLCRWDNAPHYPRLNTFPHHKHVGTQDNVLLSDEVTLEMVMRIIEKLTH